MQRRRPEPKYSFTIPSVHDDTKLECRIYHPWSFDGVGGGGSGEEAAGHDGSEGGGISSGDSAAEGAGELGVEIGERNAHAHASSDPPGGSLTARWRKKGIVVAHPYAPLGGSYDDRVVGMVVEEFVRLGWVVGTFCFRYVYTYTYAFSCGKEMGGRGRMEDIGRYEKSLLTTLYQRRTRLPRPHQLDRQARSARLRLLRWVLYDVSLLARSVFFVAYAGPVSTHAVK